MDLCKDKLNWLKSILMRESYSSYVICGHLLLKGRRVVMKFLLIDIYF